MQIRQYFDQLAPTWDQEVGEGSRECLTGIIKELGIRPGYRVLDVGSGTGVLLPLLIDALSGTGHVIALDVSGEMLRQARHRRHQMVDLAQADVMAIPLADTSLDLAICNSAFPHFGNKLKAMRELRRVLRQGGRLVICHTMSRAAVNGLHQSIGGIVASDLLPDEHELRRQVVQAGLTMTHFEDGPERYLVIAEKSTY
jgi:ubiquinone/menaquinone biosynthesis C-methylase UbiE